MLHERFLASSTSAAHYDDCDGVVGGGGGDEDEGDGRIYNMKSVNIVSVEQGKTTRADVFSFLSLVLGNSSGTNTRGVLVLLSIVWKTLRSV